MTAVSCLGLLHHETEHWERTKEQSPGTHPLPLHHTHMYLCLQLHPEISGRNLTKKAILAHRQEDFFSWQCGTQPELGANASLPKQKSSSSH